MQRKLFLVVQSLICLLFVTAVGVAAGTQYPDGVTATNFTDVPNSNPFYTDIQHISDSDIAGGYDNEGTCGVGGVPCYKPNNGVTRGQMAKFVHNARIRPGIALQNDDNTTPWDALPFSSITSLDNGTAIFGAHTSASGSNAAIFGGSNSASNFAVGVQGVISATAVGGYSAGVRGINLGTGNNGIGVWGSQAGTGWGVYGTTGGTNGIGVYGLAGGDGVGVLGESGSQGTGIYGLMRATSGTGKAVYGKTQSTFGGYAVYGVSTGYGYAVYGETNGGFGVYGKLTGTVSGDAIHGNGLPTGGNRYAGNFEGNVKVTGGTCAGCLLASYDIDDPRDPANSILSQAAVASPDYMNIYNGNITTDANGAATVQLPDYFAVLNRDYRYQLTSVGQFAQAIVAQKIVGTSFVIKTDKPNVEVSWQVTGIRNDAVAKANPVSPESAKSDVERGYYLNPELYGQPLSQRIGAAGAKLLPENDSTDALPESVK